MSRSKKLFLASAAAFLALAGGLSWFVVSQVPRPAAAPPVSIRHIPGKSPDVNSFVVTSPQGVRVFLDVVSVPSDLEPAVGDPRNLLVATHRHGDHFASQLSERFQGKKLVSEAGVLESGDVRVELVGSSHMDDEPDGHSNTIAVVQVGGLRIVHLGDCGQGALTPAQRARIGRADVAMGQLEHGYSEVDLVNRKGYAVASELAPTIFIPTHISSVEAVQLLSRMWPAERPVRAELLVTPALLAKGRRSLFMGGNLPLAERAGVPLSSDL